MSLSVLTRLSTFLRVALPVSAALGGVALMTACGEPTEDSGGCTGVFCPCTTDLDCPNVGEVCLASTCLPGANPCGNGACDNGETAASCPADCDEDSDTGADTDTDAGTDTDIDTDATGSCGDGTCDADETAASCPADCATDTCGNGTCDGDETAESCPDDCDEPATCGNGTCDDGETAVNCPADCDEGPVCGDASCDEGETSESCPDDCEPAAVCGDASCDASETCRSCEADCGACPIVCGDALCVEPTETCESCPGDCGTCPPPPGAENPWIAFTMRSSAFATGGEASLEQLWIVRADGTGLAKYNNPIPTPAGNVNFEQSPDFAPDGTRLAFVGYDPGQGDTARELRVIDLSAGTVTTVPTDFSAITNPSWLSDGLSVAVEARLAADAGSSIYLVRVSDGSVTRLTSPAGGFSDAAPFVSPTGDYVYFVRGNGTSFDVYRIRPDGSGESRVTTNSRIEGGVTVSLDGTQIMYGAQPSNPDLPSAMQRRNASGGGAAAFGEPGDAQPYYFNDSARLAMIRSEPATTFVGGQELTIVDVATGALIRRLTSNAEPEYSPSVSFAESDAVDPGALFSAP